MSPPRGQRARQAGVNESSAGREMMSSLSEPGRCDAASDGYVSGEDACRDLHSPRSTVARSDGAGSLTRSQELDHESWIEEPGICETPKPWMNEEKALSRGALPQTQALNKADQETLKRLE